MTEAGTAAAVMRALARGEGGRIETVNLNHVYLSRTQPAFAAYCRAADLAVADGMPLVWAAALQGTPVPERVAGANLVWSLCRAAARDERRVFLAGGDGDTAALAARRLTERIPGLQIAGTDPLPPGPGGPSTTTFRRAVAATAPDLVLVALPTVLAWPTIEGCRPIQPRAWWVGVGSGLAFAAGTKRRASVRLQRSGLEWVHRLAHEPRRLTGRYLIKGAPTALWLLASALMTRRAASAERFDARRGRPPSH